MLEAITCRFFYFNKAYNSGSFDLLSIPLLKFTDADGLHFNEKESVNFEVAGNDKVFYPAKAQLTKDGKHNLPASSFRTDSWELK
ncbi:hypothetical protein SAMN04487898_114167 [Pedobacter sp. ok626]|nr:hypothetical protein SAMN04487898_114167 [Pedobacter sp. ok626]